MARIKFGEEKVCDLQDQSVSACLSRGFEKNYGPSLSPGLSGAYCLYYVRWTDGRFN